MLTNPHWFATTTRVGLTSSSFHPTMPSRGHTWPYVRVRSDVFSDRSDPLRDGRDPPGIAYHDRGDRCDALILL
jgi:hypothetical protein